MRTAPLTPARSQVNGDSIELERCFRPLTSTECCSRLPQPKKYEDANEFVIRRLVCEEDVIANKFFPLMLA